MANPIDLLKSDHAGEKKTRFVIPITIVGLAMLGYAYYIAWSVTNPLIAFMKFFLAVVLVIFASYLLFTTGSIALLKILKNNKKYYYKPENFISIAGMIHRMKQNASGLASICILSTMVLVTVSTCLALFLGQEDTLSYMHKDDIQIQFNENSDENQNNQLDNIIVKAVDESGVELTSEYQYSSYDGSLLLEDDNLISPNTDIDLLADKVPDLISVSFLSAENYKIITGRDVVLDDCHLIMLTSNGEYENIKSVHLGNSSDEKTYEVIGYDTETVLTNGKNRDAKEELYFVVKDDSTAEQLVHRMNQNYNNGYTTKTILNINGSQEECYQFSNQVMEEAKKLKDFASMDSIYLYRAVCYSIYGGLLFIGAFFTIIFLCATVLIIYFKQITEGYEDKSRFEMLQKVGMDDLEVKKTINKQILIVFFLPLLGALLHLSMASNMIIKLLEVFYLYNVKLTLLCMLSASAVFAIAYILVYRLTAKTYVKIVKW
jgi:putative ABC transport system permease protein